ncbi:DUF1178 family protein [Paraburkholderia caballeronis]|uniref:Uncharacterized protein n=1 Tax=Paraburkholderia caballeronis TaxID=416943 RepID=A0A1H7TB95_9BURK|nr:DUF1178 family protein [Paraburkholderia caballeronis]PXW22635.1 hypothetical protein C7403_11328 [Paraburkholderia caballeronis]PXW96738.1 hypothetical protein C7407_11328 [Paraburkholderia caballeronis]RAJ93365.1 hypothetical protein C7409_11328 [Paraburkholderia caballeronis]TDV12090.1 hypothetical protein C7408_11029 [Paraburkholderia caballeronis]TDV15165.1 hypothetical protein C7406_11129 [Paraburkholderia caballeronis]
MKVLDLQCPDGHRFEGWFASAEEFESQLSRKLVECPVCGATEVNRLPSAPRLNLSGAGDKPAPQDAALWQAHAMRVIREVLEKTENVGDRFVEEARRIHYNEAPARNIRGVASADDARALVEEGIDVMPLPVPAALKGPLQ